MEVATKILVKQAQWLAEQRKNNKGERDPEMHQTKKGNQWHLVCTHTLAWYRLWFGAHGHHNS
jgi:hypothetical protein